MTGEEYEGAAACAPDQRLGGIDDRRDVVRGGRLGEPFGEEQKNLALMVEGTLDAQGRGIGDTQATGEVTEFLPDAQGRGGKDPGAAALADEPAEACRDIKRHQA